MKKIFYVFSVLVLFSLVSCVTADNNSKKSADNGSKNAAIENILNRKSVR